MAGSSASPQTAFVRLRLASVEQLHAVSLELDGLTLRWEELDEDITVPGIVPGDFSFLWNDARSPEHSGTWGSFLPVILPASLPHPVRPRRSG